jgi:hypothetical protein
MPKPIMVLAVFSEDLNFTSKKNHSMIKSCCKREDQIGSWLRHQKKAMLAYDFGHSILLNKVCPYIELTGKIRFVTKAI